MTQLNQEWPEFANIQTKFLNIINTSDTPAKGLIDLALECGDGETLIPFLALLFVHEATDTYDTYDIIEEVMTHWDTDQFFWNSVVAGQLVEKYNLK